MNTLASTNSNWFVPSGKGALTSSKSGKHASGQALFVAGSLALHLGALLFFSSAPGPAMAASASDISVDLIEIPAPPAEPELTPMPLGKLDAPEQISPTPPQPMVKRAVAAPLPSASPPPNTLPTAEAPKILTADNNPYAAADTTVFTSGHGQVGAARKVVHAKASATAAPTEDFGVESGSEKSSEEAVRQLKLWYAQVQAQLKARGASNYPRRAQKLGQQGSVRITVRIDASGHITATSLASSSGHQSLDRAALSSLGAVAQVSAPPLGTGATSVTFPVTFKLTQR